MFRYKFDTYADCICCYNEPSQWNDMKYSSPSYAWVLSIWIATTLEAMAWIRYYIHMNEELLHLTNVDFTKIYIYIYIYIVYMV